MVCNKKLLLRFLELIALKGDIENKETLLNISFGGIASIIGHPSKTVAIKGVLLGDFDDIGDVGIDDIPLFISLLKSFSGNEVTITKEKNKLILISENKKLRASLILREPEYIINTLEGTKIDTLLEKTKGNVFTLSKDSIKSILSYVNAIGSDKIVLIGKDKELQVALENKENEILASFDIEQTVDGFTVKLMKQITSILNIVDGDIVLSMKDDSPISITIKDENMEVIYIVAPIK